LLELCAPGRDRRDAVTRATAGRLLLELCAPGRDRREAVTRATAGRLLLGTLAVTLMSRE